MKYLLSTAAAGLLLASSGLPAQAQTAQQGTTAQQGATGMTGECRVVDPELSQRLAEDPQLRAQYTGQLGRDLRRMRNVAMQLERYGQTEACNAVAQAITEITEDPEQYAGLGFDDGAGMEDDPAMAPGVDPAADEMTWEERRELDQAEALPLAELQGQVRADDIIGSDVRGSQGESLGEVDDLVLGADNASSYVVVSYGGFLGFGQDLSAVPLEHVRMSVDGDAVYVPLTEDQLDEAPTFSRGDDAWLTDEEWQRRNQEFYGATRG